ncbi:MAG: DUF2079 domain-containing protein [Hymenobacteraceae bacterium]|nr:DUF2079 domain-containing protein [Hymenobacteraceae bacterium]MDX5395251.1 DUF2079 domain-containing protein [Hymenobacteraceae bacterium]MDX5511289.1 DUF2079 domain-containing protein [Hymenobacteraceae bacterium]
MLLNRTKKNKPWLLLIFLLFALIYSSISLINHYNFRTFALDLGMANHAIYDYAHFRSNITTLLLDSPPTNFLASHFTLIPMLVSPLYWLFDSYTLLLVQILAVLFGGWGIYRYTASRTSSVNLPVLLVLHFFLFTGIYSALAYDYHDNVVAAMLVPWFLHYFEKKKLKTALLFLVLILVSKENMALWAIFLLLGAGAKHFKDRKLLLYSIGLAVISAVYFVVVTKVVMPALDTNSRDFAQLNRYRHLGQTPAEIVLNLLTQPRLLFEQIFMNTLPDPAYDYIKVELLLVLFLSGGIALLLRPWYLIMLIPIFAQKFLSSDYKIWGINYQYAVEFAPILTLALFEALLLLNNTLKQKRIATAVVVLTLLTTVVSMHHRKAKWFDKSAVQFFKGRHYRSVYDTGKMHSALKRIPDGTAVSAQTALTPHLEEREKLYHYPIIADAEYVLATKNEENIYPLTREEQLHKLDSLRAVPTFNIYYEDEQLVIFRRK